MNMGGVMGGGNFGGDMLGDDGGGECVVVWLVSSSSVTVSTMMGN
jgi:hypothetical protein